MFKKITFIILIFTLIFSSCEGSRSSDGNAFTPVDPCNPDKNEVPVYNNNFFYLYSDNSELSDDTSVFYANGMIFEGGFSGTADSKTTQNCIIDGEKALRIKRTGKDWSAGGWVGLADQPMDISGASNLVFYARANPGAINGPFIVKMESIDGAFEYDSGFGAKEADNSWKKIEIPLSNFSDNGVDLTQIKSPFIFVMNEMDVDDVIYIDCIYLDGPVKTPGKISLNKRSYNLSSKEAEISIVDPCAVGSSISISISNGTDSLTIKNIIIDENGHGETTLNLGVATDYDSNTLGINIGDIFTVSYTDAIGTLKSDSATIVPDGTLEGDYNFDRKVYIYSTKEEVDLQMNIDYQTHHWDTFSTFDFDFDDDKDFSKTIEVQSGTGWDGTPACIAFHSFQVNLSSYTNLNFKFKSNEYSKVSVKLPGSTLEKEIKDYDMGSYEIVDGTNGWHEVSIPLSDFEDITGTDTIGIFTNSEPGTFYLTDIYFN